MAQFADVLQDREGIRRDFFIGFGRGRPGEGASGPAPILFHFENLLTMPCGFVSNLPIFFAKFLNCNHD
jgi:hypothetical protein